VYRLVRSVLFRLDAERSHRVALLVLRWLCAIPGVPGMLRLFYGVADPALKTRTMGIEFRNPVCLAAGLDKNAESVRGLFALGFGGIELGTVTPDAQPGNPPKRLFRVPRHHALINRLGFPSVGVNAFVENLRRAGKPGPIGINIGKNRSTPNENAIADYVRAFRAVYAIADYVVVNVSSPNTPQLRALQDRDKLSALLVALKNEQMELGKTRLVFVPLAIKISPDLSEGEINDIADLALEHKLDAVIATNTTVERPGMENELLAAEAGGLSGSPLKARSTEVIRMLYRRLQGQVPIVGVGGIETADDAWEKLVAGADLLQVYTGFIYQGPVLVRHICRGLLRRTRAAGCNTLEEAIASARSGVRMMR
jgi:dihydroorotate dehydrogenase